VRAEGAERPGKMMKVRGDERCNERGERKERESRRERRRRESRSEAEVSEDRRPE
jgi:hypothetical protein